MRRLLVPAALLALHLGASLPASAQLGAVAVGGTFGSSRVTGSHRGDFDTGWHAAALAGLSLPLVPIGFRAELAYDHLDNKPGGAAVNPLRVASGVLNATFSVPFAVLHPYAIGGIGYYIRDGAIGSGTRGKAGFNVGGGIELRLGAIHAFGEARYHANPFNGTSAHLVPITLGLAF